MVESASTSRELYATATWAVDQDGCAAEADIPLDGDLCSEALGPDSGNCKLSFRCCMRE